VLFHDGVQKLICWDLDESYELFKRAAAKGHKESIWILSVLKDLEMEKSAWKEAFAKTEEPLGYFFAGGLSGGRERFDFYKKSAEAGCSWGQLGYGQYFKDQNGVFVEKDDKVYVEWIEKAANQNNPQAMRWLGDCFGYPNQEKEISYYRAGAELGWKSCMDILAAMLMKKGVRGCVKDLRQAVIWGARANSEAFSWALMHARGENVVEHFDWNFDQLCYSLGWGLYWHMYDIGDRDVPRSDYLTTALGNHYLDYYCSCVELQQKSIFQFLHFWNRTTGVKGLGRMIAQMVWEGRAENLLGRFVESEEMSWAIGERRRVRKSLFMCCSG
jgi:hypothetical protein